MWMFSDPLSAQESKEINLSFDSANFGIEYNNKSEGIITFKNADFSYDENQTLPCIPYTTVNVAIPSCCQFQSFDFNADFSVFKKDIKLATNPELLPTNQAILPQNISFMDYKEGEYPNKCVELMCTSMLGDYTILSFKITPFRYGATEKVLSFSKSITLKMLLSKTTEKQKITNKSLFLSDDIKRMVVNPEDVSGTYKLETKSTSCAEDRIDYLIVTSSALKPAFVPLQEWKKMKGVRTEIITTEYIDSNYEGSSMQLKIKNCLYDYYLYHDLKYVLLGGDDSVVASQGCYVYGNSRYSYNDMPTDLYYACFNGRFDWNLDGDDIFGETTDGVDLTPYISVTRAPVRSATDVAAFVNKTLVYEKTPSIYGWNNQILMCGTQLWSILSNGKSDAEAKGEKLYSEAFTNWTGSKKCFYDTYTDFSGGASYNLTASNLQTQITNGYAFIDMMTHGGNDIWAMESGAYYSTAIANASVGNHPSIITTMACLTNAFDQTPDPCLSEAFIRNPNNGIVAYLGCSREGWGRRNTNDLGPSLTYELKFYQNMFSNSTNKSFGKIVAEAKYNMIGVSQSNNTTRWVMFGLNPIGDSEMPIYTSTPISFNHVSVSNDANNVIVNAGVSGCTICLMSTDDMGTTYYEVRENVQSAVFNNVNTNVSICITKHNYIPYIGGITYLQNETVTDGRSISNNAIVMGSHVTTSKTFGPVLFQGSNITVNGDVIKMENGTKFESNSSITLTNN